MIGLETHDVPQWADGGVREMKPWLFVGAKVVCVRHGVDKQPDTTKGVPLNSPLTVRAVAAHPMWFGAVGIQLEEIVNAPIAGLEPWYHADYFRPVSTIDTTKTVEALKSLTRDAMQGGKVGV